VKAVDVALHASPLATAVCGLLDQHGGNWAGEPSELLLALAMFVSEGIRKDRNWPKTASVLGGHLRRCAPFLREVGVILDLDDRDGRGGDRRRRYTITRVRTAGAGRADGEPTQAEAGTPGDAAGTHKNQSASPPAAGKSGFWGRGDAGDAVVSKGENERGMSEGTPMPYPAVAGNGDPNVPASPPPESAANERGRAAVTGRPLARPPASPFAGVCWACASKTIDDQGRCTKCDLRKYPQRSHA
jgi:hypothetical protein